jgi:hypothetical protein
MTFLLEMDTTYFFHRFALSKVIFRLESEKLQKVGKAWTCLHLQGWGVGWFIYRDQQNNVVGETILYLVRLKPQLFEFSMVHFFRFRKPWDMVIEGKWFLFVLLVHPFCKVGLSFCFCLSSNLVGFLQLF